MNQKQGLLFSYGQTTETSNEANTASAQGR